MQNLPIALDSNIVYNEGENQIGGRQKEGVKANLSIPLQVGGRVLGVLIFGTLRTHATGRTTLNEMRKVKPRILVADDEPRYVWAIQANLEDEGYEILTASDGGTALKLAASESPDLILLDVRMPELDGLEVCRRVREFSTVPIIMLTAMAEEDDKVKGLDVGADDYISKPFSAQDLLARVRAVLRRVEMAEGQSSHPALQVGDVLVDFVQQRAYVCDQEIDLTPTEYRLLCELVKQAGRVLVADYLLEKVWGVGYEGDDHLVRLAVHRLRRKIERDPRNPEYIQTRPGIGYVFVAPD